MLVATICFVVVRADTRGDVRAVRAVRSAAMVIAPRGFRMVVRVDVRTLLVTLRVAVRVALRVDVMVFVDVRETAFVPRTAAAAVPIKMAQEMIQTAIFFISDKYASKKFKPGASVFLQLYAEKI